MYLAPDYPEIYQDENLWVNFQMSSGMGETADVAGHPFLDLFPYVESHPYEKNHSLKENEKKDRIDRLMNRFIQ